MVVFLGNSVSYIEEHGPIMGEWMAMQGAFMRFTKSYMTTYYTLQVIKELMLKTIEESEKQGKRATDKTARTVITLTATSYLNKKYCADYLFDITDEDYRLARALLQTRHCWERLVSGELSDDQRSRQPIAPAFNYEKVTGKKRPNFLEVTEEKKKEFYLGLFDLFPEETSDMRYLQEETCKMCLLLQNKLKWFDFGLLDRSITDLAQWKMMDIYKKTKEKINGDYDEELRQKQEKLQMQAKVDVLCSLVSESFRVPQLR